MKKKYKKGAIYIYALMVITVMAIFFTTYILSSNTVVTNAQHYVNSQKAYYTATAGIEDAMGVLKNNIDYSADVVGSIDGINYTTTIMQTYRNVSGGTTERKVVLNSNCTYKQAKKQIQTEITLTNNGISTIIVVDKWKVVY